MWPEISRSSIKSAIARRLLFVPVAWSGPRRHEITARREHERPTSGLSTSAQGHHPVMAIDVGLLSVSTEFVTFR